MTNPSSRRRQPRNSAPTVPSHERNLASEQFPALNQEFYEADPAYYFQRRLSALIVSLSPSPELRRLLADGVDYGEITIRQPDDEHDGDERQAEAYASLESTNLLHHAAECMMRLYLAHADRQPCPWLEIARLRTPSKFKGALGGLRASLDQQDTIDSLVGWFFGNTDHRALGIQTTDEDWQVKINGLVLLVGHLTDVLLSDSALYNATKHGLAVIGGNHGFSLSAGDLTISTDGPALAYLDLTDPASQPRRWSKNLTFVQVESNLTMVRIIAMHIESIWKIAAYRHTAANPVGGVSVPGFDPEFLLKVIAGDHVDQPISFNTVSEQLLYYLDDEPDE